MKNLTLGIALSSIITLSSGAHALELVVVNNYEAASSPDLWKKAKADQVPEALLSRESLSGPTAAYGRIFPKAFMQEPLFAVCNKSCDTNDIFKVRGDSIDDKDLKKWDVVEQSNVYFWLKKYFNFLDQRLDFKVEKFLRVLTHREIRDETRGKKIKNNAFFNPEDISLSFLPASNNLLFKLLAGKVNRSGFDPSVVIHEASHYLFHHLFPNPVNSEIGGLNEGFADYMANIFLNNPKVGLVMLHGKTLRDSSTQVDSEGKLKTYEPGMEVHDLGERISYALWSTRELARDKNEMDRLVIDAIIDLGRDPYSTIHDFKNKMLERIPMILSGMDLRTAQSIWELTFPGKKTEIASLDFLDRPVKSDTFLGFKTRQELPANLAQDYGTDAVEESNFTLIQIEEIAANQVAVLMARETETLATPYWIAIDTKRMNVMGVYTIDNQLVTDEDELKSISDLTSKSKSISKFIKDFAKEIKQYSELMIGQGDLNIAYKIQNIQVVSQNIQFNSETIVGKKVTATVKRRLLASVFGATEISKIELYTIPVPELTDLPDLNQEKVIGYRLTLKTGTSVEVILNKYAL